MISDEELIKLAQISTELPDDDLLDVKYYQEAHMIYDGVYGIYRNHLYYHYKNWSSDPTSLDIFSDMLQLSKKDKKYFYINKEICNLKIEKVIGDYVKEKRESQKKERLRQLSSVKPPTKCED